MSQKVRLKNCYPTVEYSWIGFVKDPWNIHQRNPVKNIFENASKHESKVFEFFLSDFGDTPNG